LSTLTLILTLILIFLA